MTISTTNTPNSVSETEDSVFTPMTEKQMSLTKGGTDLPDWLQDLIDHFDDLWDYLEGLLPADPDQATEDFWEDLEEDLAEEGYVPPTEEELAQDW